MGVRNYLIEGGSGVGKTTVAEELQRRGYHVIHGDRQLAYYGDPQTGKPVGEPPPGVTDRLRWKYDRWVWPGDQVRALAADRSHALTFFCGHSSNSRQFIELFDAVIILHVDRDTLAHRLAQRPEDEFGRRADERDLVLRLHETGQGLPEPDLVVDATAPLAEVVDEILRRCR